MVTTIRIPPQLPTAFIHTPSSLLAQTQETIASSKNTLNTILLTPPSHATFQTTILPLIHYENSNLNTAILASLYKYVSPSADLREASITCSQLWRDYWSERDSRRELFEIFSSVWEKIEGEGEEGVDEQEKGFLESEYKDLLRSGAGIPPGPERERLELVKKRVTEVCLECCRNIREDKGGVWFTEDELEGLPRDVVGRFKKGNEGEEGECWVSFKAADYVGCMEYAVKEETRKRLWSAKREMCAQNVGLMKELVVLRAEQARLLRFESHAE